MVMKKHSQAVQLAIAAAVIVVVAAGCVAAYAYFTKSWFFKPAAAAPAQTSAAASASASTSTSVQKQTPPIVMPATAPLFTTANYPRVDASTATQPLALAFMKDFTGTTTIDSSKLGFTQTDQAYTRLIQGKVDLILVTSPSKDELARAKKAGVQLEVTPVVNEGFVFFVNQNNPVSSLTVAQVQDIYQGKITNWKQVGGKDEKIEAYQRPVNSGSQTGMIGLVMKGKPLMQAPIKDIIKEMSDIVNIVADYSSTNSVRGIGYSYYYYATTIYQDVNATAANNVKLLKINGVAPSTDSIKSGHYPFHTAYCLVINKAATTDSPARKLKADMLSNRGQTTALEAGYVPLR